MKTRRLLFTLALPILFSSLSQAAFTEMAARCVPPGQDIETHRYYSLQIDRKAMKGILIAVDTDKLTEVTYGAISVKNGIISLPEAQAVFSPFVQDTGGSAIIKGVKYLCDFAQ